MKKIETRKKVYSVVLKPPVPSFIPVTSLVSPNQIEVSLPSSLPYPTAVNKILNMKKNVNSNIDFDKTFQEKKVIVVEKKENEIRKFPYEAEGMIRSNEEKIEICLNNKRNEREKKGKEENQFDSETPVRSQE